MIALSNEEIINEVTQRITAQIRPESIILFGSLARGEAREDSDIDLLIVWDEEGTLSNRERRSKLRRLPVRIKVSKTISSLPLG